MENIVDISFENEKKHALIIDCGTAEIFVKQVLKELKIENWELSILLCSDMFMQQLNRQYRNIDAPTDVLSFEQLDGEESLPTGASPFCTQTGRFAAGDIVISLDTLVKNSQIFGVPADEELKRLIIHGILHLKGMNHSDNSPEQEMLKLQEEILKLFLNIKIYRE